MFSLELRSREGGHTSASRVSSGRQSDPPCQVTCDQAPACCVVARLVRALWRAVFPLSLTALRRRGAEGGGPVCPSLLFSVFVLRSFQSDFSLNIRMCALCIFCFSCARPPLSFLMPLSRPLYVLFSALASAPVLPPRRAVARCCRGSIPRPQGRLPVTHRLC